VVREVRRLIELGVPAYRDAIGDLDRRIRGLTLRRDVLARRLERAACRHPGAGREDPDPDPEHRERDHRSGRPGEGRTVVYIYALSGPPGEDIPEGWNAIRCSRRTGTRAKFWPGLRRIPYSVPAQLASEEAVDLAVARS
jgi:hypothetical protein